MRAHIVIPEELIREVDEIVGLRHRSSFLTEAIREKLARVKLARALDQITGSLVDVEIPDWETTESAATWVRSLRQEGESHPRGNRTR